VLADCLAQPAVVRELYDLAVESLSREKRVWGFGLNRHPESLLHRSIEVLDLLVGMLKRLRHIADQHAGSFRSDGSPPSSRCSPSNSTTTTSPPVEDHLRRLRFRSGVLLSAQLGAGNKGEGYVLRRPHDRQPGWMTRLLTGERTGLAFTIPDRDEAGAQALADLRQQGINLVANALAQSTDHMLSFFTALRAELGFYVGCLNLADRLTGKGEPICFPQPLPADPPVVACAGLYDACLTLGQPDPVVGNDIDADGRTQVMVTGANQGGKSTFLRSVGWDSPRNVETSP
jgi:hypothetical protein